MKLTEQELKELIYRNIDFVHHEEYNIFYCEITKYGMEIDELIQGIKEYFDNKIEQNKRMLKLQETIKLSDFFNYPHIHIFKRNIDIWELTRDKMIHYLNYLKLKEINRSENS